MPQKPKSKQTYENKNSGQQQYAPAVSRLVLIISLVIFVVSVGGLAYVAHYHVAESSYRIKFFAETSLNLLILFAVIVHAYIYVRQWEVMQGQKSISAIAERAYLGVKDAQIRNPITSDTLFVSAIVFNSGRTPAIKVQRKFQIGMVENPSSFDWGSSEEVSDFSAITASTPRRFSFPPVPITKAMFAEFDTGKRVIHAAGEFRFTDFMGVKQIFAFSMTCRSEDNGDFREDYQRQYDDPDQSAA